jgi:hypothetical protein
MTLSMMRIINYMIFVKDMSCVFSEAGTEFLNVVFMSFVLCFVE